MYIYIYLYLYLYLSIYIYIEKKNEGWECVLFKRRQHSCVLLHSCKRTLRSLRSFMFFRKNAVFFAFFYVLKKRAQKKASFFWVS